MCNITLALTAVCVTFTSVGRSMMIATDSLVRFAMIGVWDGGIGRAGTPV